MKLNTQLPVRQAILDRKTYEPPGEGRGDKMRLDFNENTAGCSSAVRRALGKLTPQLLSMYPEYDRSTRRLSRHFKVKPDQLLLTNGGDDALRVTRPRRALSRVGATASRRDADRRSRHGGCPSSPS